MVTSGLNPETIDKYRQVRKYSATLTPRRVSLTRMFTQNNQIPSQFINLRRMTESVQMLVKIAIMCDITDWLQMAPTFWNILY